MPAPPPTKHSNQDRRTPPKKSGAVSAPVVDPAKFTIAPPASLTRGWTMVLYGASGMGKSTLAALAPKPVFLPIDDGAGNLGVPTVRGIENFSDLRAAVRNVDLFADYDTVVLDNLTKVQDAVIPPHMFEHIPHEKGQKVDSLEKYGWGSGYSILTEQVRLLLSDFDVLSAAGKNVILLCQESVTVIESADSLNYMRTGPALIQNKKGNAQNEVVEWADHVVRIAYLDTHVIGTADSKVGKIASTEDANTRVLYTQPERSFMAKTRRLNAAGAKLDPVISFEDEDDASLWETINAAR